MPSTQSTSSATSSRAASSTPPALSCVTIATFLLTPGSLASSTSGTRTTAPSSRMSNARAYRQRRGAGCLLALSHAHGSAEAQLALHLRLHPASRQSSSAMTPSAEASSPTCSSPRHRPQQEKLLRPWHPPARELASMASTKLRASRACHACASPDRLRAPARHGDPQRDPQPGRADR